MGFIILLLVQYQNQYHYYETFPDTMNQRIIGRRKIYHHVGENKQFSCIQSLDNMDPVIFKEPNIYHRKINNDAGKLPDNWK